jgi:hypothetical protein
MTSPLERARLLDAEMQLQRAWLELNLREMSAAARSSPWAKLQPIKLGLMGLSFFKHRSLWLAAISMLMNAYRRRTHKEKR